MDSMLTMLRDLVRHKGHTDAALLKAIRQHETASTDAELLRLLNHILLSNRFWLMLSGNRPFVLEEESRVPESLDLLAARYRETHTEELAWVAALSEEDLARQVESPFFGGQQYSIAEGFTQVCMHSHGHRSQCATRLRQLGGTPPVLDFILWLKDRPTADWS
jgi:uncharacterized damage-inducible protein DinB